MPLTGTFPDEWGVPTAFQALQILRINFNDIEGTLPPQWGSLNAFPSIGYLDLGWNQLTGTIPAAWAAPGAWPNLRKLYLNKNRLSGSLPATWANQGPVQDLQHAVLQNMEYMYFMENLLTGTIPVAWGAATAFPNLQVLNITSNPNLCGPVPGKLKGITYCSEAPCASTIQCANGSMSEPGWVFNPTYSPVYPTPSPPPAAIAPQLSLDKQANAGRLLVQKAAISNWDTFARDNGITGWDVAVDACQWSGVRCDGGAITSLTLKTLAFSNQSLSGTLPPAWGQSSTGTRRLQASSDSGAFPALRELLLSYNDLTGSLPAEWAGASAFPSLTAMDLEHNQLSGQLGAEWGAGKPYTLDLLGNPQLCAPTAVASSVQVAQCAPSASPVPSSGGGSSIGVIVGAVVGALAVLAAAAFAIVVVQRKRKRRAQLEKDWMGKEETAAPNELDSMVKAGPGQQGEPKTQPVQPPSTPPAVWVAPVLSGSPLPSPPVTVPGSDHAGSPAGSLAVSSLTAATAAGAAAGGAVGGAGNSAQRSVLSSTYSSIHRRANYDPESDALLSWVQRQAPAVAQATACFPGLEGQASGGESDTGLVDISAWRLNFLDLKIFHPLGEGSFGRVYLASYYETLVAIKILVSFDEKELEAQAAANLLSLSSPILAALNKEASLLASLRHPNVVQFIGVTTFPPAIITEFCSRGSLADVLRQARSSPEAARELTWPRRLAMALDAALGVLYLHTRPHPIVHRDLKSPNLLVEDSWRVKVTDLNLSRLMESANVGSKSSSLAAMNPRWLAPEVMQGERPGPAADVFSFAVVLWEILTFDFPWTQNSAGSSNPWQAGPRDASPCRTIGTRAPPHLSVPKQPVRRLCLDRTGPATPRTGQGATVTALKLTSFLLQLVGLVLSGGRLVIPPRHGLPGTDTPHFQGLEEYTSLLQRCWAQLPLERPSFDQIAAELRSLLDRTMLEMGTLSMLSSGSR
ncbi:hypothetical protein ABPG77_007355 [Micractinium sp. CCAP 211/92]